MQDQQATRTDPAAPPMPHNVEAEQQILGALLCDNSLMEKISGLLDDGSFYDPVHADLFRRIKARIDAGQLASPVTLKPEAQAMEQLKLLGGPVYLVHLAGAAISQYAIRDYALLLADLKGKRDLLEVMRDGRAKILDGRAGTASIAADIETGVGKVSIATSTKPLIRSFLSASMGALQQITDAYHGEKSAGVSTGLPHLDKMLSFMRPGNMILLGARPSMGKTTVAQNIAYHCATNGVGVFFGSLEMMGEDLAPRFFSKGLAQRGFHIPYTRIMRGDLTEDEMRAVVDETKRQMALPIIIGERDVREVSRFRMAARRARQQLADTPCPLGLIVVDYVQQMHSKTAKSTYDRASEASDTCKSLAMEFGVPVLALAQLSREVEKREPPIPMLADLRETGKLEEDADVVLFCYRDAYYLQRKLDAVSGDLNAECDLRMQLNQCEKSIDIIVAKQRSGPIGVSRAYIDMATCNLTPDRSEHVGMLI